MAGTLESSDVMVRIAPAEAAARSVDRQQRGKTVRRGDPPHPAGVLQRYEVEPVQVIVDDKGRWTACCAPGWKQH